MNEVTYDHVLQMIIETMVTLFEFSPDDVKAEAKLADDLDLDSIDAVDLIVHLQKQTNIKIQPDVFKSVVTVDDVAVAVTDLLTIKKAS